MSVVRSMLCVATTSLLGLAMTVSPASATTDPGTLTGEGGAFAEPIVIQLINDASTSISPEYVGYEPLDVDSGREAFADGDADFAVSEYPLTASEQAEAASIGRSYTYVPFAAVPVDIGVNLLQSTDTASTPNTSSAYLDDMQFTQDQLFCLFTPVCGSQFPDGRDWDTAPFLADTSAANAAACQAANDPNALACQQLTVDDTSGSGGSLPIQVQIQQVPDASLTALETLFANSPATQSQWNAWASKEPLAPGTSSNPQDELWPSDSGNGKDQDVEKALFPEDPDISTPADEPLNEYPIYPDVADEYSNNGSIAALPSDWMAPYIPQAKVQNGAGDYVLGTTMSAQAALSDASVASNNLVTFPANDPNPNAYPLTQMSYLIVPTSGLSAVKDASLAKLIDFILSSAGAADIEAGGATPITESSDPALYAADSAVATQLQSLAAAAATSTATTTPTTTTAPISSGTSSATTAMTTSSASSTASAVATEASGITPKGYKEDGLDSVGSAGGTFVGTVQGTRFSIDVPAGDFDATTQLEISSAPATSVTSSELPQGDKPMLALALTLSQGGIAITSKLASPIKVTLDSLGIASDASLLVFDSAKAAYTTVSETDQVTNVVAVTGELSFDIASDPEVALVEPPATVRSTSPTNSGTTGSSKDVAGTSKVATTSASESAGSTTSPSGSGSGATLAFTGFSPMPLAASGAFLLICGEAARRRRRRPAVRSR